MTLPLRRNRDFQLLWAGQVLSDVGSRASAVAFPLLVLALTGSPARAGLVMFAGALPFAVFTLPAGALVDRLDRRRVMLACDLARLLALGSVAVALWLGRPSFAQILVVAFVDGTGFVFFEIAQRAALRNVVAQEQLPAAIAQNQAREYTALLVGQPLGGLLFGLARMLPFAVDAASYAASAAGVLLIRKPLQEAREAPPLQLRREIAEGLAAVWRQPLLRTTSLLVTVSDLTLNMLYLVVIVVAKDRGASAALVGAMFAFVGAGGVLGAAVAPFAARLLPPRIVVVGALWTVTALVAALALVPGTVVLGVVYGAMFFVLPSWNAVVGAYRIALVPDSLQGRVQSVATLFALGPVALGSIAAGVLLERLGSTPTLVVLFALMASVSAVAATSTTIRRAPRLRELAAS